MWFVYPRRRAFGDIRPRDSAIARLGPGLALLLGACLTYGCVAYQFTSDLVPVDENEARGTLLQNLVLGVDRPLDKAKSYDLEKFLDVLKKSRVFRAVELVEGNSSPDLVLTSFSSRASSPYHACLLGFEGQVLTIATGGLLPQICKSEHEVAFDLYAPKDRAQRKTISFRYQTRSILGWAALFYLPSSDWSAKPVEDEYSVVLRASFYRQANEIQQLLK